MNICNCVLQCLVGSVVVVHVNIVCVLKVDQVLYLASCFDFSHGILIRQAALLQPLSKSSFQRRFVVAQSVQLLSSGCVFPFIAIVCVACNQ